MNNKLFTLFFKLFFALDFSKGHDDFKESFDDKIKRNQAANYIGPDHEKYSKNIKYMQKDLKKISMFFNKIKPEEQSVDKDKNPTPTTKTC